MKLKESWKKLLLHSFCPSSVQNTRKKKHYNFLQNENEIVLRDRWMIDIPMILWETEKYASNFAGTNETYSREREREEGTCAIEDFGLLLLILIARMVGVFCIPRITQKTLDFGEFWADPCGKLQLVPLGSGTRSSLGCGGYTAPFQRDRIGTSRCMVSW